MVGGFAVLTAVTGSGKLPTVQNHGIELFFLKLRNGSFPVYHQCQGRRHHTPHIQGLAVKGGEQTGSGNAHQPVGFCPAKGSFVQPVILRAGAQGLKALTNGTVLHAADPQPFKGFSTPGMVIDQTENQFAFPSCVGGTHKALHIRAVHQGHQHFVLFLFVRGNGIFPLLRNDRQILVAPLGILGVIAVRSRQPDEMTDTPAHHITVSL